MEYGLLGEHLPHSFSKIIHEKIGLYNYELKELSPNSFEEFMKNKQFKGVNVTIPYKQKVMDYCDYIDDKAKEIGAVNTVVNKDGKLYGYNTDFYGLKLLCVNNSIEFNNKKVLILGNGGTSKTAMAVAKDMGAKHILIAHYKTAENIVSYDDVIKYHTDVDFIINTTPVGMFPKNDGVIIDLLPFKNLSAVIDVIYNPINTNIVLQAKSMGIKAVGGLYMLVAQAVKSADLFLKLNSTVNILEKVYSELLKEKLNIILIGMPASGKSTIARAVCQITGQNLIDTDELIVEKYGNISEIFKNKGEEYFRNAENQIIKEVAKQTGVVISTGGGAVLKKENVNSLKQNGLFYFLDRPLNELLPTDDRPLANDVNKIKKLYNERIDLYKSLADITVKVTNDPQFAVDQILKS